MIQDLRAQLIEQQENAMNANHHLQEMSKENEELKSINLSNKDKNKLLYEENKHLAQEVEELKAVLCEKDEAGSQMNRFFRSILGFFIFS